MPFSLHTRMMVARVMPGMQYWPVEVHTSPRLHDEEMRRVAGGDEAVRIEHQRFIGPGIGGLDAGRMQLSFECELSFWSCTSG